MAEPCPVAIMSGVPNEKGQCPYLEFDEEIASCGLSKKIPKLKDSFGFGKGCCMLGRIIARGIERDFASLPKEKKQGYVRMIREGQVGLAYTKPKGKE